MKNLLLTLCILAGVSVANAQVKNVEYSASFEEPEDGWNKLLQLSNGNTFHFLFTKKDGINITVYNKERRVTSKKNIESDMWESKSMGNSQMEGIYEIGGRPVVFLHQIIKRVPYLFRLQFNPQTGELEKEEEIAQLPKYKMGAAWAMAYGGVKQPDFYVEKDPASDNYAVVNFNTFAGESDERIVITLYGLENGQHKVLSTSNYDNQGFKYLNYLGMTVVKGKTAYIAAYGYNTKRSGGEDSRILISKLDAGNNNMINKQLEFSDDFQESQAILKYNPHTNMLQLLTLTFMKSKSNFWTGGTKNYFLALMNYIDPESLFIVSTKPMLNVKANEFIYRKYDYDKGIGVLPQDMIINNDNTTTIISEEIAQQITYNSSGAIVSATTSLGSLAITEVNERGEETEGIAMLKSQNAQGLMDAFYAYQRSKGLWSFISGGLRTVASNAFLSFDYINTQNGKYVLFNDYPENYLNDDERKKKTIGSVSNTNTVVYKLKYNGYDRHMLYGNTTDDESNFSYIESASFQPSTNTYAVLMVQREKRKKQSKIAWATFE